MFLEKLEKYNIGDYFKRVTICDTATPIETTEIQGQHSW